MHEISAAAELRIYIRIQRNRLIEHMMEPRDEGVLDRN
jgi:hypothetical protein